MIKVVTGMLIFGLILPQSPIPARKSERESNGFVGPVKRAHEEWSPVSGYPYASDARCRARTHTFDQDGRLTQYSYYSGGCGSDENREDYKYDQDGSRTTRFEYIQGENSPPPPPPPMMPPGAAVKGLPKTTFTYDAKGMLIEKANFRGDGKPTYKSTYKYDEKGRPQESEIVHSTGERYRFVSKYEGEKRFPESEVSFDGNSNNPRSTTTYTDYELNPQGDWIKRKVTRQETGGRTYVAIHYRRIEYYSAKK
jgi:hypothetical protein